MAALLTGIDLALCMANRLKVYLDYFDQLPSTLATTNFETALIKTYSHTLQFLANAIQIYQKSVVTRTWQALWQTSELEDFEIESNKLGNGAELEASNCDRNLRQQRWEGAKRWKEDLEAALRKLDNIRGLQSSVNLLYVKVDLAKLTTAKGASYNSYADENSSQCLQGTRTQLLRQVAKWTDDPYGKCIFWLCGMAGTGKSTISRTVSDTLHKQRRLGASFFFKRGESDRANAYRFFPAIAIQLADIVPSLGQSIAEALEADSLLCDRNLQEQFDKLLAQPLANVAPGAIRSSTLIIVIDALDECNRENDIRIILRLLARLQGISWLQPRVFVTSRPDLPIKLGFFDMHRDLHEDVILEQVQATTIRNDLCKYFLCRFEDIKKEDWAIHSYNRLSDDWPGDNSIEALVELADPLFIFAFTMCRYISESDPAERLNTILQQRRYASASKLEDTYKPVLNQLIQNQDPEQQNQALADFRELVGAIVLLADPLSALSLSRLLGLSLRDISIRLKRLNSVLDIPAAADAPIRLLHLSFRDFLVDVKSNDTNKFRIDETLTHNYLSKQCLRRLVRPGALRQDLLGLGKPGTRRDGTSQQQVAMCIPEDIAYACCHWVWHLTESEEEIHNEGHVHQFLEAHFLHWLEALSWLGRLSQAVLYISDLRSAVQVCFATTSLEL